MAPIAAERLSSPEAGGLDGQTEMILGAGLILSTVVFLSLLLTISICGCCCKRKKKDANEHIPMPSMPVPGGQKVSGFDPRYVTIKPREQGNWVASQRSLPSKTPPWAKTPPGTGEPRPKIRFIKEEIAIEYLGRHSEQQRKTTPTVPSTRPPTPPNKDKTAKAGSAKAEEKPEQKAALAALRELMQQQQAKTSSELKRTAKAAAEQKERDRRWRNRHRSLSKPLSPEPPEARAPSQRPQRPVIEPAIKGDWKPARTVVSPRRSRESVSRRSELPLEGSRSRDDTPPREPLHIPKNLETGTVYLPSRHVETPSATFSSGSKDEESSRDVDEKRQKRREKANRSRYPPSHHERHPPSADRERRRRREYERRRPSSPSPRRDRAAESKGPERRRSPKKDEPVRSHFV